MLDMRQTTLTLAVSLIISTLTACGGGIGGLTQNETAPSTDDGNSTPDNGNTTPDDGGDTTPDDGGNTTPDDGGTTPLATFQAFATDGELNATIRWTEFGVPHITGNSLEETSFGTGYAFARDNYCLLIDQITKYNSERSRYFGPDQDEADDALNLINDFSYLALGIRAQAEAQLASLSENARALLSGYSKGVNQYLQETGSANLDPHCANKAWVRPITETDVLTFTLGVALLPGSANFLAPIFRAAPPSVNYEPTLAMTQSVDQRDSLKQVAARWNQRTALSNADFPLPNLNAQNMASNGWGLGKDKTENGKGMVLANPHFPHTGNLRFWQFQVTYPGFMNVMGASLAGMPGVVNIGFNENLGWTHTFSSAEHFVLYKLDIDSNDTTGMTYTFDGQPRSITSETYSIQVLDKDSGLTYPLNKTVYSSHIGPMVLVPGQLGWDITTAYSLRDANRQNVDILDHWLAMNRATTMTEFKQAFQDYDGVVFNNTMAADKEGNTFYIDDSTVPNLPATAVNLLKTDATTMAIREIAGFAILPASSDTLFTGAVPYAQAPKLERSDFVQNSNDSFWLTNPASPITGASPLYGATGVEQSLRSRMGQRLLSATDDASGIDGKYSLTELEAALLNNRTYLGEAVLSDLLSLCQAQGTTPVNGVNLQPACAELAGWDGKMNKDSTGAVVFREFAQQFELLDNADKWQNDFDATNPVETPNTLATGSAILEALAAAVDKIAEAGQSVNATLGDVQFVERSTVSGAASGTRLPWAGANEVEGGFNVFTAEEENDGSLIPRHVYPSLADTQLSAQGYHVTYGSSWMYVLNFTDTGPVARGLLAYSQSIDPRSSHYQDQTSLYSTSPSLRPIRFTEADIDANKVETKTLTRTLN